MARFLMFCLFMMMTRTDDGSLDPVAKTVKEAGPNPLAKRMATLRRARPRVQPVAQPEGNALTREEVQHLFGGALYRRGRS